MSHKPPSEPIEPTSIPGEPTDPRIAPEPLPESEESDQERQARESEKAFDQAITRIPG